VISGLRTFFPFHRTSLVTGLPPDAVRERLAGLLHRGPWFARPIRGNPGEKPFRGTVEPTTFTIQPRSPRRTSFIPVILGTIEPSGAGSRVTLEMRLPLLLLAYLLLLGSGACFVAVVVVATRGAPGLDAVGIPLIMLLIAGPSFRYEANRAIEILLRELTATEG
jgi:hypothetical protein